MPNQRAEHSASGLGRAFSGEGAVADNASVLARNPAAMTLFKEAQFSGALSFVEPEIDVYDETNKEHLNDIAPSALVPAGYYISPINDKWAWGIGMFTTYGVATDYPDDITASDIAGDTALASININPNIAYRINEQFSIAGGINLVYAEAELTRHKGILSSSPAIGGNRSDKFIGLEGETISWGWNLGALFELNENNRFGLGYRSKVDLDFDEGEFTSYVSPLVADGTVDAGLEVSLPAIIEFSAFHQLNDQWAIHYSWQQTDWSTFDELKATSPQCNDGTAGQCFAKPEKYEDNNRYSFGGTYTLNNQWTLRAGVAYDEQAGKATLSIPDTDRMWYSAGMTYAMSDNLSFDAGFTLVDSEPVSFTEKNAAGQEFKFNSEGPVYIGAVQMNYTFK